MLRSAATERSSSDSARTGSGGRSSVSTLVRSEPSPARARDPGAGLELLAGSQPTRRRGRRTERAPHRRYGRPTPARPSEPRRRQREGHCRLSTRRVVAVTRGCGRLAGCARGDVYSVVVVDSAKRRVLDRRRLAGSVLAVDRTAGNLAILLGPSRGIGVARLALVGAAGEVRAVTLSGVRAGGQRTQPGVRGYPVVFRSVVPALAVGPDGCTAAVVSSDFRLTTVDLRTLWVGPQRPLRMTSAVTAPVPAGVVLHGAWLDGGRIAVWGKAATAFVDAEGGAGTRERPLGLRVYRRAQRRPAQHRVSCDFGNHHGRRASGLGYAPDDASGIGLVGLTAEGRRLFHVWARAPRRRIRLGRIRVCVLRGVTAGILRSWPSPRPGRPRSACRFAAAPGDGPATSLRSSGRRYAPRMADTERRIHETTAEKLAWLEEQRAGALHAGSEAAEERQRLAGKLLAPVLAQALRPGHVRRAPPLRPPPRGRVRHGRAPAGRRCGRDRLRRRCSAGAVMVFSQDFTVFGGSLSEAVAEKVCKVPRPGREVRPVR